jgi:serine-type D-Ala-D-Ala carboxypeptidase/endopeptidase (penicillin-binding protein 4)
VVCVETRHMQAVLKAQINKTDRNDARGMAQMMRVGLYRPVHVKTRLQTHTGSQVLRSTHTGVAMWSRLFALALLLLPAPALADVKEKVAALATSGLVLVVDGKGNELVAQNADEPFVPASVTKIVTAWLALEVLGSDYRFETRFYLDDKRVLYVRGGGDPFLISEELALLATNLVAAVGKEPINGMVLDASYYPSNLRIPGIEDTDETFNALNSALAVNFNTISAVRIGDKVSSAEKQTPITPLAITLFRERGPNGNGRISLSRDPAVSLQYAGELIAAFIGRAGGRVKGEISTGTVKDGLKPVYVHRQSRTLSKILAELLRASNNYVANQVFLEIGGHRLGGPVSLEKSLKVANEILAAHDPAASIHLEEVPALAATIASPPAASPKCSSSSRPTPTCSTATTAG